MDNKLSLTDAAINAVNDASGGWVGAPEGRHLRWLFFLAYAGGVQALTITQSTSPTLRILCSR